MRRASRSRIARSAVSAVDRGSVRGGVWFYDLHTHQHFTLKTRPLGFDDLREFVDCFHAENRHERQAANVSAMSR